MMPERQKVWLSIKGNYGSEDVVGDDAVFLTEGDYYREQGATCLSYEESEMAGMGGTTTTVRVNGDKVSVIRLGSVNSIMEFEQGKHNLTMYSTPYGDISMGIFTKEIDVVYNDQEAPVSVKVDYDLEIKGISNTSNRINIEISSCPVS
ncbi:MULTISPECIES: DUF1934 domain-containing protein [Eubacterium]|uniref:Uncharacterized beta-barrel protein YwiB, DUF1934 family n=2 Tax=Eubacterium TaxID=1730 RepID=A0A1H4AWK7_9FIRM|nr:MULTISPECIES: DUF1934 domain-containing protein [Eubacterium]MDD4690951.1 DUF1934 domain-containing protein [Eubacterium aggregans]MEA5073698.1 DUF1934 domain-containing protein [Eubacterium aggregans]SDY03792.1 Uncharacterized beta-barrel protein YwiB, DUF1934 family [Eubacterium barkeri]SEA40032.1 Uncharacterized beta-barrel protein YwiB, DUF1934 family [Eubacterium aggregans]